MESKRRCYSCYYSQCEKSYTNVIDNSVFKWKLIVYFEWSIHTITARGAKAWTNDVIHYLQRSSVFPKRNWRYSPFDIMIWINIDAMDVLRCMFLLVASQCGVSKNTASRLGFCNHGIIAKFTTYDIMMLQNPDWKVQWWCGGVKEECTSGMVSRGIQPAGWDFAIITWRLSPRLKI